VPRRCCALATRCALPTDEAAPLVGVHRGALAWAWPALWFTGTRFALILLLTLHSITLLGRSDFPRNIASPGLPGMVAAVCRICRHLKDETKNMDTRLEQALRTLRAIRQRYETESDAGSGRRRSYTVQIALGYGDMRWIAAAIEALEKATPGTVSADSSTHLAVSASQQQQPSQPSAHTSSSAAGAPAP
jgi:hypothetical protein